MPLNEISHGAKVQELAAAAYFRRVAEPLFLSLAADLARFQPDRPGAFIRASLTGVPFEGAMRGEATFDAASAEAYMKILGSPMLVGLSVSVMATQPPSSEEARALLLASVDAVSRLLDESSEKISSQLRGYVARKKVTAMRLEAGTSERAAKAQQSAAYAPGAVSRRAHKAAQT
jgi:hypothetical protein